MVVTMWKRFGDSKWIGQFLLRRFIRIYPIYWVYLILICFMMAIHPQWVNSSVQESINFFSSFLLLPAHGGPILLVDWSLKYEVFFYALFAFLMLFPLKYLFPVLTVLFVSLSLFGEFSHPQIFGVWWITRPFLLEFLFGVLLGYLHLQKLWGFGWFITILGVAIWCFDAMGTSTSVILGIGKNGLDRPLYLGIPAALILFGLVSLEKRNLLKFPLILQRMGDASYSIYLSQVLFISACGRLWMTIGFAQNAPESTSRIGDFSLFNIFRMAVLCICGKTDYKFFTNAFIENPGERDSQDISINCLIISKTRY